MAPEKRWLSAIALAFIMLFTVMRAYNLDEARPTDRYIYHVIPVALSVLYYHWPYDYTGSFAVESAIIAERDNLPPILRDVTEHREEYEQDKRVYFWRADDRGTLDFTVAAFYLFGPKINSMAYFYMMVLAASVVVFSLMHRRDAAALKTLTFALMALIVCLGVWNFINQTAGSRGFEKSVNLSENRLFGLLAFFPVLSLFFLVTQRLPMSRWQSVAAVFQSLLFVEIVHARMSVLWLAPPLLLIATAGLLSRWVSPSRRNAVSILAFAVLGMLGKSAWQHAAYNQEYFAEKGGRTIWHNVVIGLSAGPLSATLGVWGGDPVAARAVLRYEKSGIVTVDQQHLTPAQLKEVEDEADAAMNAFGDHGTYDWPAHERKARRYVFAVFETYPWETLKTFLWLKPLLTIEGIADMLLPHRSGDAAENALPLIYPMALAALIAAIAGYFAFGGPSDVSVSGSFHAFLGLCVIFSLAIPIAFYSSPPQLGDVMLSLLVWGLGLIYEVARRLGGGRPWKDHPA